MYKVIKYFCDLQDGNHPYNAGDTFPRPGMTVTEERLAELAGSNNRQGVPLIAPVAPVEPVDETPVVEEAAEEAAVETPVVEKETMKATGKRAKKTAEK